MRIAARTRPTCTDDNSTVLQQAEPVVPQSDQIHVRQPLLLPFGQSRYLQGLLLRQQSLSRCSKYRHGIAGRSKHSPVLLGLLLHLTQIRKGEVLGDFGSVGGVGGSCLPVIVGCNTHMELGCCWLMVVPKRELGCWR